MAHSPNPRLAISVLTRDKETKVNTRKGAMDTLTSLVRSPEQALERDKGKRLVEACLSGLSPNTLRTYQQGLGDFVKFLSRLLNRQITSEEAARILVGRNHGDANGLALDYKNDLLERDLSAATINLRLAALRKVVETARFLGWIPWGLEVKNVRNEPYRDTRGPGVKVVQLLVDELGDCPKDQRDRAIIRLLYDLSLRRAEVVNLDVEDIDLRRDTVSVLRKGQTQKRPYELAPQTAKVIADWLEVRGTEPGPLFLNFDRAGKGSRLTGTSIYRNLEKLGARIGVKVSPHQLRHTGITVASIRGPEAGYRQKDLTQYSGHKHSTTLDYYLDTVENVQGKVARLVASEVE